MALMDDSDEHIEVRTSPEGKVLQCDHQEKNPPRHGVDFFASLWRRKTGPSKVSRASESHQVSVQGPEVAGSSRAWRSRQCQRQCQPAFELWLWLSAAQGATLVNAMLLMPNGGSIFLNVQRSRQAGCKDAKWVVEQHVELAMDVTSGNPERLVGHHGQHQDQPVCTQAAAGAVVLPGLLCPRAGAAHQGLGRPEREAYIFYVCIHYIFI